MSQSPVYKLTEAEPVPSNPKSEYTGSRRGKGSKFYLCFRCSVSYIPVHKVHNSNRHGGSGRGRHYGQNRRDGGRGRERRFHDESYYTGNGIYIPDTPETREYYARSAMQQM